MQPSHYAWHLTFEPRPRPDVITLLSDFPEIPGYRIESPLGAGGMATVYRARQLGLDRLVAIKVLRSIGRDGEELNQRFEQEAKMIAALDHPNIVAIYEVTRTTSGDACYVMPLLDYGDLGTWPKPTPELQIKRVIGAVLEALGHAHKHGVVHRDVKAENVLFDVRGTPMLADFGVALKVEKLDRLTVLGRTVGSSQTMSPEQARGEAVDGRSDLYSVGCLIFELLVGEQAFAGDDFLAVALKHQQNPVPRLPEACAHWQPFLDQALAKRPDERFATAADMAAALLAVGQSLPSHGPVRRASWRLPLAVGGALLGVLLLLGMLLRPDAPADDPPAPVAAPAILAAPAPAAPAQSIDPFADALGAIGAGRVFDGTPGSADALLAQAFASEPVDARAIDLRDELLAKFETQLIDADDASLEQWLPRWKQFVQVSSAGQTPPVRAVVAQLEQRFRPVLQQARNSRDRVRASAVLGLAQILPQPSAGFEELVKEVAAMPVSGVAFRDAQGPELLLIAAGRIKGFSAPFAVTRGEITRADYARFAKSTGRAPASCRDGGRARSWQAPGFDQQTVEPVVCVSFADASAYAQWLTRQSGHRYRLPTLNEWRALDSASRAGICANLRGENADCNDQAQQTAALGRFPAAAGMPHDLAGNVREWTSSCEIKQVGKVRQTMGKIGNWFTRKDKNTSSSVCVGRYVAGSGWRDTSLVARAVSNSENAAAVDTGFRLIRDVR